MSQRPPELPPEYRDSRRAAKWKVGVWATVLVSSLLYVAAIPVSKLVGRTAGRKAAMHEVARQASSLGAPAGLFGTKWLMSASEVSRVVPSAEPDGQGSLIEYRTVYDRDAKISYGFEEDRLLIVLVTFRGPATEAQYHTVQSRLKADYGLLSAPVSNAQYKLYCKKQVDRFLIEHLYCDILGVPVEQILFARSDEDSVVSTNSPDTVRD